MAHFKCVTCSARVWRDGFAAEHPADLCPGCGGPVEAVSDLSELVGLRALRTRPRNARPTGPEIADHIRDTIAVNDAWRRWREHHGGDAGVP